MENCFVIYLEVTSPLNMYARNTPVSELVPQNFCELTIVQTRNMECSVLIHDTY